jgi:hypothetical protein
MLMDEQMGRWFLSQLEKLIRLRPDWIGSIFEKLIQECIDWNFSRSLSKRVFHYA